MVRSAKLYNLRCLLSIGFRASNQSLPAQSVYLGCRRLAGCRSVTQACLCFCTNVVILATIAVSRVAERAKKLEEELNKGILGLGVSHLKD